MIACAAGIVAELPVSEEHRRLLALHLDAAREQAEASPQLPSVQLPLLVYRAAGGDEQEALPLAAACLFVYLGADLLDNVADAELDARWRAAGPAAATLAGATMLAVLPQLALERLERRDARDRLTRLFADRMLEMSAGQHADVASDAAELTLDRCREIADGKSGAQGDLYARAGAVLAGAGEETAEAYGEFGRALLLGAQLASDLGDLLEPGASHDLAAGKRTLPLVHVLGRLDGESRLRLERMIESGERDADELAALLGESRSIHHSALVVEVCRQRALRALARAGATEPARGQLEALAGDLSSLL